MERTANLTGRAPHPHPAENHTPSPGVDRKPPAHGEAELDVDCDGPTDSEPWPQQDAGERPPSVQPPRRDADTARRRPEALDRRGR